MSSSARETILSEIRRHLGNTSPTERVPPGAPPTQTSSDLAEAFQLALEDVGGRVHRARTLADAGRCLRRLVSEHLCGERLVFSSATPKLLALLEGSDLELVGPDGPRTAKLEARVGVTEAQLGIAETGTLVLCSDREENRLASLLPRVHIALLQVSDLTPDLGAALARLHSAGPPPVVTFITGPSRTGDIELTLVVGVHGPEELHVVLVHDPPPDQDTQAQAAPSLAP